MLSIHASRLARRGLTRVPGAGFPARAVQRCARMVPTENTAHATRVLDPARVSALTPVLLLAAARRLCPGGSCEYRASRCAKRKAPMIRVSVALRAVLYARLGRVRRGSMCRGGVLTTALPAPDHEANSVVQDSAYVHPLERSRARTFSQNKRPNSALKRSPRCLPAHTLRSQVGEC